MTHLPSNDHLVSHLTQRLFLHYLERAQPAKYHFYPMRCDCLINITRKTRGMIDNVGDVFSGFLLF